MKLISFPIGCKGITGYGTSFVGSFHTWVHPVITGVNKTDKGDNTQPILGATIKRQNKS